MPASLSDMNVLSGDPTFQGRVRAAIVQSANNIKNEGTSVAYHRERETFCTAVMNAPDTYKVLFANSVATDANVIADATVNGTVVLTGANVAAQAALVTDAHINTAVSSDWNTFFRTPAA